MKKLFAVLGIAGAIAVAGCSTESPSQKELANEIYSTCLERGDMTQYECGEQAKSHR
jgi:hypothetical protein